MENTSGVKGLNPPRRPIKLSTSQPEAKYFAPDPEGQPEYLSPVAIVTNASKQPSPR